MQPGGGYARLRPAEGEEPVQVQRLLLESRGGVWRR
jgi:hypothetical protein